MSDILHKTLKSYHENNPWDDSEEHPDGLLWLLTPNEWEELPKGTTVESIWGERYMKGHSEISVDTDTALTIYGLRGYRD